MCTVTWQTTPAGYALLMNRDELNSRSEAHPPRVIREAAPAILAPIDRDAGGTWIAANDRGVTVCLLNRYPSTEPGWRPGATEGHTRQSTVSPPTESRGLLVRQLGVHPSAGVVIDAIRTTDLRAYSPFTLLIFEPNSAPKRARWDGFDLVVDVPSPPVVSSSFQGPEVTRGRIELYKRKIGADPTVSSLRDYHTSHVPERGPYSVCVHREDGGTVSLTEINVTTDAVQMSYVPGPPCGKAIPIVATIGRA